MASQAVGSIQAAGGAVPAASTTTAAAAYTHGSSSGAASVVLGILTKDVLMHIFGLAGLTM